MKPESKAFQIELVISDLLLWGVRVSLCLLAGGTLLSFLQGQDYGQLGGSSADFHRLISQGDAFPRSLAWLCSGLLHLQGQSVIVLGMLLLISTPIVRVFVSIFAFALERDRSYVLITSIVFLLLLLSFALGKTG
jgi:uncharacterized membrane protein